MAAVIPAAIAGGTIAAATTAPAKAPPALEIVQRATADGVIVARLANGLTVIVKEHRAAPVVTVKCYVRAGAMYEGRRLGCGLSHLLEHLLAKGAVHQGQGGSAAAGKPAQTTDRVREIGGQSNAYTSRDHTCYYISATASRWAQCIDLIADWMARPQLMEEDFLREHSVVQRELEKGKDEPSRQASYAHAANIFATHPAAAPVIGYAGPLSRVTLADVQAYHSLMYVPQNMVFVIVGDVDADAALARTARAFAGFERGRSSDFSLPQVPAFSGIRRAVRRQANVKEVIQSISFQSIPLLHEDLHALDVLAYVLGTGQSSRLYRTIQREQKLVTSISCSSWTPAWGRGVFTVRFRAEPSKADQAEKAILAELHKVVAEEIEQGELERAKRQKIADDVYSRQTADSIASSLARDYMTTGDVQFSKNYTKRIQAVTAEQILKAARKYITLDRMAITRLTSTFAGQAATDDKARQKVAAQVFTLRSGLRVVLKPDDSGLVSMVLAVKGGLLAESDSTSGLGALAASLTTKGTGSYTADQIAEFFDKAGGSISGNSGNNTFYWRTTVLEDSFDEALTILAGVVARPTFDRKELDTLRPVQLARIKRSDESLMSHLNKFFRSKFFASGPYGRYTLGRAEVVRNATAEQIREFYSKSVAISAGVLAVCGQFETENLRERLEELFPPSDNQAPLIGAGEVRTIPQGGEQHVLKSDMKQAGIIVAGPGMRATNLEDRFAIDVLDAIISGYRLPSGWMHEQLRGAGLVYVVHSYSMRGVRPGAFITYAICQPKNARQVIDVITANLRKAASYTPTQKEVDLAVNTILTAELLEEQSPSSRAMSACLDELYGLGHDFRRTFEARYRRVTPQDVLRAGKKYLSGDYVVTVTTPAPEVIEAGGADKP